MMVTLPAIEPYRGGPAGRPPQEPELSAGVTVAREDKVVGRCLVTVFVFSLLALAFLGQMPVVAAHNLGIDAELGQLRDPLRLLRDRGPPRRHLDRDGVRPYVQTADRARLPARLHR